MHILFLLTDNATFVFFVSSMLKSCHAKNTRDYKFRHFLFVCLYVTIYNGIPTTKGNREGETKILSKNVIIDHESNILNKNFIVSKI